MMSSNDGKVMVARPRPGSIQLSTMIEYMCQKTYTDLMRLVDLLPSKTDLEKKIELATFFSRTRNTFIRLEALVKWANSASKVDKCEKISNFLGEQSFFLLDTANCLSALHQESLVNARLPPFAVILAVDIFVNKAYTRLPKCIKSRIVPPEPISEREVQMGLLDLNRIIKYRLSVTQIPRRFLNISIKNGRVTFTVPHEFKVTLTVMSEALDFPWRILSIAFLVSDPEKAAGSLLHPLQTRFIYMQAQSRILYKNFDKRPPLVHLYDMLHSFSISLQLDVLYEQAHRLRSKRPTDPFSIESYRRGEHLIVGYWRGLSACHFQAIMGSDGKLRPSIYSIKIHVDNLDPQRPLCLTHSPELCALDAHKIGSIVKGDRLSIENLLTRTVIVRAERILEDLKIELLPLSPGPITMAEIPLSLSVPLLWPCHSHELLYLRVDPSQGLIRSSLAGITNPDPDSPLAQVISSASFAELEAAFNRPSAHRVRMDSDKPAEKQSARGLRSLTGEESRWQAKLVEAFARLRIALGQARITSAVSTHRPFWQAVIKNTLPLDLPTGPPSALPYWPLLERMQQGKVGVSFIRIFPNDDHYLASEVISTPSLSVDYRYYLIKCTPVSLEYDTSMNSGEFVAYSNQSRNTLEPKCETAKPTGMLLRITHFLALNRRQLFCSSQQSILESLRASVNTSHENLLNRRLKRVKVLLDHLPPQSVAKRRCLTRLDSRSRAVLDSFSKQQMTHMTIAGEQQFDMAKSTFNPLPDLSRLLSSLEEEIISNVLILKLSEYGISHGDVQHDSQSNILSVDIHKIPIKDLPAWALSGHESLCRYAKRILLLSSTKTNDTPMRVWRMNVAFANLPTPTSNGDGSASGSNLIYQSVQHGVNRLSELGGFVRDVVEEWGAFSRMFALCEPVLCDPKCLPQNLRVKTFDPKSLVLSYGPRWHYLAELSIDPKRGCKLSLGVHSGPPKEDVNEDEVEVPPTIDFDLFENPHCLIREHLETLIDTQKSIEKLAMVLSSTLDFMLAMEYLKKPMIMNKMTISSTSVAAARPLKSVALIAVSCFDLMLVYRGTLCLRFHLIINSHEQQQPSATSFVVDIVQLSDGCRQPAVNSGRLGATILSELYPIHGFAGLPAFQHFLNSIQNDFRMDHEESWRGLTVGQLAQLIHPPKTSLISPEQKGARGAWVLEMSPLDSYLSASLLWHFCHFAVSSLQALQSESLTEGELTVQMPASGLIARLALSPVRTSGCDVSRWRLVLKLTEPVGFQQKQQQAQVSAQQATGMSQTTEGELAAWFAEFLPKFEEFFDRRVCTSSPQKAAVVSFFRLLSLPIPAIRLIARLFVWDVSDASTIPSQSSAPIAKLPSFRLGLISLGAVSPDCPLGESAVVVRGGSELSLQILMPRATVPSQFSTGSVTEVIPLTYDWAQNQVRITPGNMVARCELALTQRKLKLDEKMNTCFAPTKECTLIQLILQLHKLRPQQAPQPHGLSQQLHVSRSMPQH